MRNNDLVPRGRNESGEEDMKRKCVTTPAVFVVGRRPRRSVRLLVALVRGAWIVRDSWLLSSICAGAWAPFTDHAVAAFSGSNAARTVLASGADRILHGLRIGHKGRLAMEIPEFIELVTVAGGQAVQQLCDVIVVGEGGGQGGATWDRAVLVTQRWLADFVCEWQMKSYD